MRPSNLLVARLSSRIKGGPVRGIPFKPNLQLRTHPRPLPLVNIERVSPPLAAFSSAPLAAVSVLDSERAPSSCPREMLHEGDELGIGTRRSVSTGRCKRVKTSTSIPLSFTAVRTFTRIRTIQRRMMMKPMMMAAPTMWDDRVTVTVATPEVELLASREIVVDNMCVPLMIMLHWELSNTSERAGWDCVAREGDVRGEGERRTVQAVGRGREARPKGVSTSFSIRITIFHSYREKGAGPNKWRPSLRLPGWVLGEKERRRRIATRSCLGRCRRPVVRQVQATTCAVNIRGRVCQFGLINPTSLLVVNFHVARGSGTCQQLARSRQDKRPLGRNDSLHNHYHAQLPPISLSLSASHHPLSHQINMSDDEEAGQLACGSQFCLISLT